MTTKYKKKKFQIVVTTNNGFPYICIVRFEDEIKTKGFDDPRVKAHLNVMYTGSFLQDQSIAVLKPHKINDQHYNILRILRGKYPNIACPGEVKEVLLNKRGDLTRLLDKLVQMNLVERETNSANRRMIDLKISDKGLKLLDELEEEMVEIKVTADRLTDDEANLLSDLLDKLRG